MAHSKNLRESTFLDFTSDNSTIEEIIGFSDENSKQEFLSGITDVIRARSFIDYAEFIGDKELLSAVQKEFKSELNGYFNE